MKSKDQEEHDALMREIHDKRLNKTMTPEEAEAHSDKVTLIVIHIIFWPWFIFIAALAMCGGSGMGASGGGSNQSGAGNNNWRGGNGDSE